MDRRRAFPIRAYFAITTVALCLLAGLAFGWRDALNPYATNIVISFAVFLQGLAVLQIVWKLEMDRGKASFPFAWVFLAAQHLSFGFGGLLVSIFDQSYTYENNQGVFSWEEAILPLLLVHALSLNAGLLGTWLAIWRPRSKNEIHRAALQGGRNSWQWEQLSGACYISLLLHVTIWIFFGTIKDPSQLLYLVQVLGQCTNATFILWGLVWATCTRSGRWFFIVCGGGYGILEAIEGNRGFFAWPVVLFGIGYLVSTRGRAVRLRTVVRWSPLIVVLFFAAVRSEDVRLEFSRGEPKDAAEAMDRFGALVAPSDDSPTQGYVTEKSPFRLGSRLFELSAADVITRTPDQIPYWGWTDDDWAILLTGFVPLKLNPSAEFNNNRDAGVLFLQSYGWTYVDPTQGSSMPATLVGDSWRRFGWAGVAVFFLFWSWFLAKTTVILRFGPDRIIFMMFGLALAANTVFYYVSDMTYLVNSLPRRMAVMAIYAVLIWSLQLWSLRGSRRPRQPMILGTDGAALR
jgi:hypothetical protein